MSRKRLGELLVERRVISVPQLEEGLRHQRETRQRLGAALVAKGFLSEETLTRALSEALQIPLVELATATVEWGAVHLLRPRFCETHDLFPFALEQGKGRKLLVVAMSDPLDLPAIEEIEFTTGLKVSPRLAPRSAVRAAILKYHHKVEPETGEGMTILPRGGGQLKVPPEAATPPPLSKVAPEIDYEDEEEVIVGEAIEPTARTSLEELIAKREQQRKERRAAKEKEKKPGLASDLDYLFGLRDDSSDVERLERKFWALMRLMARKGLISSEEFAEELDDDEG